MEILARVIYGNSVKNWLISLAVFILLYLVIEVVRRFFLKRLTRLVEGTGTYIDDVFLNLISQTKSWFILLFSLFIASQFLILPDNIKQVRNTLIPLLVIAQVGFWGNGVINFWITRQGFQKKKVNGAAATNLNVMGYVLKVALWALIVILFLDNIPGVEVNSLIASLGIGGVAVALAVQNILGDLFASLSIALDKPFVIGDFIAVGDFQGNVEKIGLNSTRIRSLDGQEFIFSNSDLLNSRISNFKSMQRRRVLFTLGVAAETPYSKLKDIPEFIQEIIASQESATFDRAHFKEIGDFSLVFEVVYHVESPDYTLFRDIQQTINLQIIRKFEEEKIVMPYPTQTIILEKTNSLQVD